MISDNPKADRDIVDEHIKKAGLTQKKFAEKAGIPTATLNMFLNGKRKASSQLYAKFEEELNLNSDILDAARKAYEAWTQTPKGRQSKLNEAQAREKPLGILSNWQISLHVDLEELIISPFDRNNVKAASIDLTRGEFKKLEKGRPHYQEEADLVLEVGESAIVYSLESIGVPDFLTARAGGISWLMENGISVCFGLHLDPGWTGKPFALLQNIGYEAYHIPPGDAFLSVEFSYLSTAPDSDFE